MVQIQSQTRAHLVCAVTYISWGLSIYSTTPSPDTHPQLFDATDLPQELGQVS